MTSRFVVGDTRDQLALLEPGSVDLVLTSPPFLALRSYLPSEHGDKHREVGGEATPADFIDTLLDIVEACDRVLAPHGSICIELGDTYSGSGGAGGDYNEGGLRDSQQRFNGAAAQARAHAQKTRTRTPEVGWPMDKSICFVPQLFGASLAYGRNLLRPERATERWRVRNVIAWCRPNPPVGQLGDKFRPATSHMTVACKARDRWFDLDAVREPPKHGLDPAAPIGNGLYRGHPTETPGGRPDRVSNAAGAPPLDYWEIPTQPYKGSHYATWPEKLCIRPILAMCPESVCTTCGEPRRRITQPSDEYAARPNAGHDINARSGDGTGAMVAASRNKTMGTMTTAEYVTVGWTDCGHGTWRRGVVLDPFAGSGTTLSVAEGFGRNSIGIDLDARNAELAVQRCGMFLEVTDAAR